MVGLYSAGRAFYKNLVSKGQWPNGETKMQLVSAALYDHPKFHDGYRCYLVTSEQGEKLNVIETATLVAGQVCKSALRQRKTLELQPRKLRASLLECLKKRRRFGLEVSEKQVAAALYELGAGKETITKTLETATMPEIIEKRAAAKAKAAKEKQFAEEMVEQQQAKLLADRMKAELEAEQRVEAEKVRYETGFAGGSKRLIIADMLCRPEGATSEEMAQATGWKKVSAATFAKIKDRVVIVRKEKTENGIRYFGQRVAKQN